LGPQGKRENSRKLQAHSFIGKGAAGKWLSLGYARCFKREEGTDQEKIPISIEYQ